MDIKPRLGFMHAQIWAPSALANGVIHVQVHSDLIGYNLLIKTLFRRKTKIRCGGFNLNNPGYNPGY